MEPEIKLVVYMYTYLRFIHFGWIILKRSEQETFYYDNTPSVTLYPESECIYLTFALTEKRLFDKLRKRILKESDRISKGERK